MSEVEKCPMCGNGRDKGYIWRTAQARGEVAGYVNCSNRSFHTDLSPGTLKRSPMKRTELKRRTPLAKKRTTPRRHAAGPCDYSTRCKRRASVIVSDTEHLCPKHATWTADKLVGDWVKARDGRCMLIEAAPDTPCSGTVLYWCHLIPKGAHPAIRWEPVNAVAACNTHHMAFDRSEVFRDLWRDKHLGVELNADLKRRSVTDARPPVADIIREFRELAAA